MGIKSTSAAFRTFMNNQTVFTDVIAIEKLFPFLAPEGSTFPLATYTVKQIEFGTKDADQFDIVLFVWFANYNACVELIDALTLVFKDSDEYDWKLTDVDFNEEIKVFNGIINITKIT